MPGRRAVRVELPPELLEQQGRVVDVGRRVVGTVAGVDAGVLPVDVDPVEDARGRARPAGGGRPDRRRVEGQVALQQQVHAGGDERLAGCGGGGNVGEVLRPGPAAERHHDVQVRVRRPQLQQLVEVAVQVLVRVRGVVGDAVDALLGGGRRFVVGPRIGEPTCPGGRRCPERIVEHVQLVRRDLLDEVAACVTRPVREERGADVRRRRGLAWRGRLRRGARSHRDCDEECRERGDRNSSPHLLSSLLEQAGTTDGA